MPKPTGRQILGALLRAGGRGLGQYYQSKEEATQAEEEKKSQAIRDAYTFALTQRLNADLDEAAIQKKIMENLAYSLKQPQAAKLGSSAILPTKLEQARQSIKARRQRGAKAPSPTYRPDLLNAMATDPAALVQGSQSLKNFQTLINAAQTTGAFPGKTQKDTRSVERQAIDDYVALSLKGEANWTPEDKLLYAVSKPRALKEAKKQNPINLQNIVMNNLKLRLGEQWNVTSPEERAALANPIGRQSFPEDWIDIGSSVLEFWNPDAR